MYLDMFITLFIFFAFLVGLSKACFDKIEKHWDKSIFSNFKAQNWFNPNISWKNKYKDISVDKTEKFPLSTTLLVSITDFWHLLNTISIISYLCGMYFYHEIGGGLLYLGLFWVARTITFHMFFTYFLNKKINTI